MPLGACVIIEPRKHKALELSLRFTRATIPDWPIVIFHGTRNEEFAREAAKNITNVEFRSLHEANLSIPQYNILMTRPSFYQEFAEYDYMLVFQTDSLLMCYSPYSIEDFLGYDYVGAPWKHFPENCGGNGGLSLRRIKAMITVLRNHPYLKSELPLLPEDLYISKLPGLHFPPRELSQQFSAETILHDCPFGTHKPFWNLKGAEWDRLVLYAPAVKLLKELNES